MKVLLIAGGAVFLLLSLALLAGAIVLFVTARKRRMQSAAPRPAATPASPPLPVRPPIPEPPPFDPNATLMVGQRSASASWGALHAVSGKLAGRIFPVDMNGFYIGREQAVAQVVVDEPSVSKRHLWIGVREQNVVAVDQQSTNGTFLNMPTHAITEVRLKEGDTIILADDVARFTYHA